ncbi:hypothetical protein C8Q76DRAFT_483576 [Earliella scabrosa]|nr:hypothetical protein C8Q76DRAFT_483576 [Earliella scabrosa]
MQRRTASCVQPGLSNHCVNSDNLASWAFGHVQPRNRTPGAVRAMPGADLARSYARLPHSDLSRAHLSSLTAHRSCVRGRVTLASVRDLPSTSRASPLAPLWRPTNLVMAWCPTASCIHRHLLHPRARQRRGDLLIGNSVSAVPPACLLHHRCRLLPCSPCDPHGCHVRSLRSRRTPTLTSQHRSQAGPRWARRVCAGSDSAGRPCVGLLASERTYMCGLEVKFDVGARARTQCSR